MDPASLWKAYFWVAVVIFGGRAVSRPVGYFAKPGLYAPLDVAEGLLGLAALAGLWGFVERRPLLSPWAWYALLAVLLALALRFFLTRQFRESAAALGPLKAVAAYASVLALAAPMYIALALYAAGHGVTWT